MKHKPFFALLAVLALLTGLLGARPVPVHAASFVVDDSTDDANAHDKNPGDGTCASWYNTCTLRAAIDEANALAGAHTITFASPMSFYLDSTVGALNINTQIRLDASGVWDVANDQPGVSLNGGDQSAVCIGIYGTNVEVYGLFIYNCFTAISIYSSNNTVGGTLQGQRNVLSGNAYFGVYLGTSGAQHNVVQGNWIGLSLSGDTKAPNSKGVYIANGAHDNTIGGDTAAKGNYISGNTLQGVSIQDANSDGNRLGGNMIGLPAMGYQDVGNGAAGVWVNGGPQNTQVGGSGMAGNTISMNGEEGVFIQDAHNNRVEANSITWNKTYGVYVRDGADNRIQANTIAHNTYDGVYVRGTTATGNAILANSIHDNGYKGIDLFDGGNTELAAPTITTASSGGASGTGCAWCTIHVYSDAVDEGETYHGFTSADGSGHWSFSGFLSGPNVTATNTDPCGRQGRGGGPADSLVAAAASCNNTSEFSAPFAIGSGAQHKVFLPFIVRNH
jgi:parallel beta-helix repeat protein